MSDEGQMQLFELTPAEANERSKRLAAKVAEYNRVEGEKKAYVNKANGQMKEIRASMTELSDTVLSGKEWRELLGGIDGDSPYRDR